jgi:hypothetical protein
MIFRFRHAIMALAAVVGAVTQARAEVVFQSDYSSATGTPITTGAEYSQVGDGTYYGDFVINGGWNQTGQVLGWSTGTNPTITGILLNENGPATFDHLVLTPGTSYTLSFNYWGDNRPTDVYGPGSVYGLDYTINGITNHLTNKSWTTSQLGTFNNVSYTFTASGPSTSLIFTETTPSGSEASPIIGNITVASALPIPGSFVLLFTGLVAFSGITWMKKQLRTIAVAVSPDFSYRY